MNGRELFAELAKIKDLDAEIVVVGMDSENVIDNSKKAEILQLDDTLFHNEDNDPVPMLLISEAIDF